MPYEPDVSPDFTPVVLAANEVWQCREGRLLVTTSVVTDKNQGVVLEAGAGLSLSSGLTVNYRKLGQPKAALAREEV